MSNMSEENQKRIIEILTNKGAIKNCPRCGNDTFGVLGGYINLMLSKEIGSIILGGPTVPTIVTYCQKCGFISQHAAGALGIIPEKDNKGGKDA
jgi:ribosomal protein S27AE